MRRRHLKSVSGHRATDGRARTETCLGQHLRRDAITSADGEVDRLIPGMPREGLAEEEAHGTGSISLWEDVAKLGNLGGRVWASDAALGRGSPPFLNRRS